jgi:hypothetical protein
MIMPSGYIDEYERCVICGKRTDVRKNIDIKDRPTYVAGAGQLCKDCYKRLYLKSGNYLENSHGDNHNGSHGGLHDSRRNGRDSVSADEFCESKPQQDAFGAFLGEIHDRFGGKDFPNMAVLDVPKVLEENTKEKLMAIGAEAAGKILINAIRTINSGSTEKLDALVNKSL